MINRWLSGLAVVMAALSSLFVVQSVAQAGEDRRPNFLIILTDDLGYGDLGCYGARDIATPHIDRMAKEGTQFSSFYVCPVCSPTRASLLTGCLARRVGINGVLFPRNNHGLNPEEQTLPELLKKQGYATALVGKWHLGNEDMFQPLKHGFDTWYGTPASNSQFYHPTIKQYAKDCVYREGYSCDTILKMTTAKCPLIRDNLVVEVPADQTQFTQRYTQETIRFIRKHQKDPFFIYLAHNMPHLPLHASKAFVGKSKRGIYGDVIQELDWSTGEILKTLKELGLDKSTMVIFTSDNGPKLSKRGSAGPLRGEKGSTYEGGVRVPFLARWPGRVPAGRKTDEPITVMDLLPTLVQLAGGKAPKDRVIDGKNIWPLLSDDPKAVSPHEAIFYTRGRSVQGIRVGDWKYRSAVVKIKSKKEKKTPGNQRREKKVVAELFNLRDDIGEQKNLITKQPERAARLKKRLEAFRAELEKNLRPPGIAE